MRYHVYTDARHPTGAVAAGHSLTVYDDSAGTSESDIYASESGGNPIANPVTVPATGIVDFWAESPAPWGLAQGDVEARPLFSSGDLPNVRSRGATGLGIADDTAAIQAALTAAGAGGRVYVPGGVYKISAPLVIHSNTHLELAPDATIILASGSGCNILRNAAVTPQRTVTDAAIDSAGTTLTSVTAAFTNADVGRTAVVAGGRLNSAPLVANIVTINGGTSVELSVAAGASVTGVACNIHDRDTNIVLTGGTWDQQGNDGAGYLGHLILMRHVDGIIARDIAPASVSPSHGYGISCADVTNVQCSNLTGRINSAVIQFDGPASNIVVRDVFGTASDDAVAFTATNGATYAPYRDCCGDITDVEVENVLCASATSGLKFTTGDGTFMDRVRVRGVNNLGTGAAWVVGNDTGIVAIGSLLIEGVTGSAYVQPGGQIDELTIRNTTHAPTVDSSPAVLVGSSVRKLTISGARCKTAKTSTHLLMMGDTQTMQSIDISDVHWDVGAGSSIVSCFSGAVTIGALTISRLQTAGAPGSVVSNGPGGTLGKLSLSDVDLVNTYWLADLRTTTDVFLANVKSDSMAFYCYAPAALTVYGSGIKAGVSVVDSGAIASRSLDFRVNVALLTKHAGDMAYNTNGGLGCGEGPVICDGTNWKHLYTGAVTA